MEVKMEKEPESIAVMKPEYAASEYSSASEPPPAYKIRQANSVKIAKIIAFTIIFSSFIMGSFILGSTYLQAKASCDQVQALDAVLDKELMLEALQQELPRSEALQSRELNNNVLQDLSKDEMNKPNEKDETNPDDVEAINTDDINTESDSDSDSDENDLKRVHVKLPLDLDLSDLAHAVLMNNQKSRMNCVVERRRTEEMPENMPFQMFLNEPKKEKVTGERIAIFCETGEPKTEEPQIQVRRIIMPFPFPGQMHRFSPQFPPQFGGQNQMNMPPPPPQFNPQFNPQFAPQNQMQMPMPPQMQQQQMPFQMRFPPPPPMQMNFPQQAPQNMQPQQSPMAQLPPVPAQQMQAPRPDMAQFRLINPMQQQQQQLPNFDRPMAQQLPNFERPMAQQLPNFERPLAQQLIQQIQNQQQQQQQQQQQIHQLPNFDRPLAQQIMQQIQQQERSEEQPEVRIHLRRIQLPGPIGDIFPFLRNINNEVSNNNNNNKDSSEEAPRSGIQVQQMPLAIALQKVGITADDLRNIQRMAEERFQHEIRELVSDDNGSDDSDSDSESDSDSVQSDEDTENGMQTVTSPQTQSSEESQSNQELHEVSAASQQQNEQALEQKPQILALGRSNFGRSLNPVLIPVPMTQLADEDGSVVQRAAFVQPR